MGLSGALRSMRTGDLMMVKEGPVQSAARCLTLHAALLHGATSRVSAVRLAPGVSLVRAFGLRATGILHSTGWREEWRSCSGDQ